jgi:hypothetical protein
MTKIAGPLVKAPTTAPSRADSDAKGSGSFRAYQQPTSQVYPNADGEVQESCDTPSSGSRVHSTGGSRQLRCKPRTALGWCRRARDTPSWRAGEPDGWKKTSESRRGVNEARRRDRLSRRAQQAGSGGGLRRRAQEVRSRSSSCKRWGTARLCESIFGPSRWDEQAGHLLYGVTGLCVVSCAGCVWYALATIIRLSQRF